MAPFHSSVLPAGKKKEQFSASDRRNRGVRCGSHPALGPKLPELHVVRGLANKAIIEPCLSQFVSFFCGDLTLVINNDRRKLDKTETAIKGWNSNQEVISCIRLISKSKSPAMLRM